MAVIIRNESTVEKEEKHYLCDYDGFVDNEGRFFLITDDNIIILMREDFLSYNLSEDYDVIEDFLGALGTTLVRAYKTKDFDIIIELE